MTAAQLKIADDLSLPLDVVTEVIGFLGRRGQGKSSAAQKLAEEMYRVGAQFVAFDPVGIWWALRLAADGKAPGLPIPVFGGLHGDIPLESTGGRLVADLIVDRGMSAVIDVSQFPSDAAKARFAADFADQFFQRKKRSPSAVHIFIEEAQEFIPQNPQKGEETQMLHFWTRMAKIGRNFGIGLSIVSLRPQEVNKKVLNLAEVLFVFQLTGPQERKTVQGWIADKGISEDITTELTRYKPREPRVWSPSLLGLSKIVRIATKTTFDASSTPKVGLRTVSRDLSPIDIAALTDAMAATIEHQKENDPKELKRTIADLRRQLNSKPSAVPNESDLQHLKAEAKRDADKEWKARFSVMESAALESLGKFRRIKQYVTKLTASVADLAEEVSVEMPALPEMPKEATVTPFRRGIVISKSPEIPYPPRERSADNGEVSGVQRKILNALAELEQLGARSPVRELVAMLAGYSNLKSAGFVKAVSTLRTDGHISYPNTDTMALTDSGRELADFSKAPRTAKEVQDRICTLVGGASERILRPLIKSYPHSLPRSEVASEAGYGNLKSAGFVKAISRLRSLGFIDYPDTQSMVAKPVLFLEAS